MTRRRLQPTQGLIARSTGDENFAHCIAMLGPAAALAEEAREDDRISEGALHAFQIAVEVALAFARDRSLRDPVIAASLAQAEETLRLFRAARTGRRTEQPLAEAAE